MTYEDVQEIVYQMRVCIEKGWKPGLEDAMLLVLADKIDELQARQIEYKDAEF